MDKVGNCKVVLGWAQSSRLLPQECDSYSPWGARSESELFGALRDGGDLLVAWSAGAHFVLRYWQWLAPVFDRIVLASPFSGLGDETSADAASFFERVESGKAGIAEYASLCSCSAKELGRETFDVDERAGLARLMHSRLSPPTSFGEKVTLVHGQFDRLLVPYAVEDIIASLEPAQIICLPCGHWIPLRDLFDALD